MGTVLQALIGWLGTLPLGAAIRDNEWVIPALQCIHIACIAGLFSSVVMMNLRLMGVFARTEPVAAIADRCLSPICACFVLLFLSGSMLVIGEPRRALRSPAFALKMLLLVIAAAITWFVYRQLRRNAKFWELSSARMAAARVIGAMSMTLWVGVIFAGRWIAYIHSR